MLAKPTDPRRTHGYEASHVTLVTVLLSFYLSLSIMVLRLYDDMDAVAVVLCHACRCTYLGE